MDRLFLDANVLFSAAHRKSAGVGVLWSLQNVELSSSRYAAEEARRNLAGPEQRARLDDLLKSVRIVEAGSVAEADRV